MSRRTSRDAERRTDKARDHRSLERPARRGPRVFDPDRPPDLRRRRRAEVADTIAMRADWLAPEDRPLVLAIYRDGTSAADLAALVESATGTPIDARVIRRRVRRAIRRLLDPKNLFIARSAESWSSTRRRIATEVYLRGRSRGHTAALLGLSLYSVRKHTEAIDALFDGLMLATEPKEAS